MVGRVGDIERELTAKTRAAGKLSAAALTPTANCARCTTNYLTALRCAAQFPISFIDTNSQKI